MFPEISAWIRGVSRVTALTGAGISTESGIPDYRGPSGLWTKNPDLPGSFTYQRYVEDTVVRQRYWRHIAALHQKEAEPNAAHSALVELETTGLAIRIITQNVDGLHKKAGSSPRKVLELHGSAATASCLRCGSKTPTTDVLARVDGGEPDPVCSDCGGVLKPSTVLFGEHLDQEVLSLARSIASASQLFLVIGSSLTVEPAAGLCSLAVECGATLLIINRDPTPFDHLATGIVREPIGVAIPSICAALIAQKNATRAAGGNSGAGG